LRVNVRFFDYRANSQQTGPVEHRPVRRLGVSLCLLVAVAALGVTLAVAAGDDDPLEFSVVGLDAQIGDDVVHSSGTVIDADAGLVLTTAHSVWGAKALRLETGVGVLHGRIVARAPCADLALVETQPRIPGLTALKGASSSAGGTTVVARAGDGRLVRAEPAGRLPASASGAPVIDDSGEVAGVVIAGYGKPAVRPWPAVQHLLDELQPGPRRIYVGWRDQYRCTPMLHRYATTHRPGYHDRDAVLNAPLPATRLPGTEGLDR
jgi:hypothetical protein